MVRKKCYQESQSEKYSFFSTFKVWKRLEGKKKKKKLPWEVKMSNLKHKAFTKVGNKGRKNNNSPWNSLSFLPEACC